MRYFTKVTLSLILLSGSSAYAEETTKKYEISENVGVTTDYKYRGISQTRGLPALQGGLDLSHPESGIYIGSWASTIKWLKDAGGDAPVELDLYVGKKGTLSTEISYDIGVLHYNYPGHAISVSPNTTEIYGQLGYKQYYAKYSHSVTNLFGFEGSKNSGYLDLGANYDIGFGSTLNLHVGHQNVRGHTNDAYDYTDWKVGVSKDLGIAVVSLSYIGTNTSSYMGPSSSYKNLGKSSVVLGLNKAF